MKKEGLIDRIKNLFSEEIEEEPIKKEVIQVAIPAPVIEEEKKEENYDNKETKYKFPVYFDDKDFDTLEKRKQKLAEKKEFINKKPQEEKRYFKLSPIISPVYGILDKNYHKDDITTRKKQAGELSRSRRSVSIDDVRKKAFGTLEDELENTMFEKQLDIFDDSVLEETKKEKIELFDEIDFNLEETFREEKHEQQELDFDFMLEEDKPGTDNADWIDVVDDEKADDEKLFDLIDMMHEKRENE